VPAELRFSSKVFDLDTVKKAAYRFSGLMSVDIQPSGDEIVCTLTFQQELPADDCERAIAAFKAEVLDQDLRGTLARETAPLRNAILAYALSKTSLQSRE
jgi:His-Xaa-Ser system protein HxsD